MQQREIVVSGFINEKFGTTYGRSLFHYAIFNGSVEINHPYAKYLIDLYEYARWDKSASSEDQIHWSKKFYDAKINQVPEALASWVQHYDPVSKMKKLVEGACVYLPQSQELFIHIHDSQHEVVGEWTLEAKHCTKTGANKPVFIATNVDLH